MQYIPANGVFADGRAVAARYWEARMTKFISDDFVRLRKQPNSKADTRLTLAFGDEVEVGEERDGFVKLRALTYFDGQTTGWADNDPALELRDTGVLKFSMVDVQQGDGLILESPQGKIVFFDGGDNKLFARHAAARFQHRNATAAVPLPVDAIVISHGDADHFDGLNDIKRSERARGIVARKRLFIHPKRVYHNGLVKMPGNRPNGRRRADKEMFGQTIAADDEIYAVELHTDPRTVATGKMNGPFKRWVGSLNHWGQHGAIDVRRIAFGDDEDDLFDFLHNEGITVELQGPFPETVTDPTTGDQKTGLRFFRAPKKSADMHLTDAESGSVSASHTINGHSIALRIRFGAVRLNLTGDLNRPAMRLMRENLDADDLEAEIVKAPHHGSGDFDFAALKAMRPVAAIISSGDESVIKEHIHPRATLMAALGKVMRFDTGIIFNTELAAFFHKRDYAHKRDDLKKYFKDRADQSFTGAEIAKLFTGRLDEGDPRPSFYAFERTNFGIINVRTDGKRVLIFTHSGKKGLNEAYVFEVEVVNGNRVVKFADKAVSR